MAIEAWPAVTWPNPRPHLAKGRPVVGPHARGNDAWPISWEFQGQEATHSHSLARQAALGVFLVAKILCPWSVSLAAGLRHDLEPALNFVERHD